MHYFFSLPRIGFGGIEEIYKSQTVQRRPQYERDANGFDRQFNAKRSNRHPGRRDENSAKAFRG